MKFDKEIVIEANRISEKDPVYIIAEAGVNHGGDLQVAFKLIDVAAEAGADAVKFQAFRTEHLILDGVGKAPYQKKTTEQKESQYDMLKRLELRSEQYIQIKEYCEKKGITFLITPFDEVSLQELEDIHVGAYKVASTDTTNLPLLKKIAMTGKPIILSTGMCDLEEVAAAVEFIQGINKKLILLQCTANYPIQDEEANLNVIPVFIEKFDCLVGYSDHSVGIGAAPFAVPYGAVVLEKHFTLDKEASGPDHSASLSPAELKDFVQIVRRAEKFRGSPVKVPTSSEKLTKQSLQKCLVASVEISKGQTITEAHLVAKRTGGQGISPLFYQKLVGGVASRDYKKNEIIDEPC